MDRVGRALSNNCCFEGLRVGDLLKQAPTDGIWTPERKTHRGRVTMGAIDDGDVSAMKLVLKVIS